MRQANGNPLPPGVKFYIWPRYVLSVDGIEIRLSRYRARILMLLMSRPGHVFSAREIGREIYWDRDDGGALTATDIIPTQILNLRQDCMMAGIDLCLKKPGAYRGYAFTGIGLAETGKGSLHAKDLKKTKKAKEAKNAKARKAILISQRIARDNAAVSLQKKGKPSRAILPHPDTFAGSGGWMFPANYERRYHRTSGKDGTEE